MIRSVASRLVVAVAVSFALVAGTSLARADEMKVGVVDMQKALQSVEAGKKAKAQLEKEFNAKKKELETEKTALEKAGAEFKKQSLVMNDEARAKKQNELQERYAKLQENMARSQGELQQKELELTQPILAKLRGVIAEIAKQKNLTMVLEKNENTVLFSQEKDDLTSDVIASYNKQKS